VRVALADVATVSTPVRFQPDSRVTVPLTRADQHGMPAWVLVAGLGAVAVGVLLGGFALTHRGIDRRRLRRRLRQLDHFTGAGGKAAHQAEGNAFVRAALALSDRAVQARGNQGRLEATLEQAAIDLRPDEWILLRIVAIAGCAAVAALLLPWAVGLILGAVVGWLLPEMYRRQRAARRARRFADLLPEALQLVVGALRSGFSLPQAVDALVREGPDPVAGEFSRAVAEVRLGGELEDALERVAARNDSRDLSWLVMAIRIQREVGGNLSEVMETAVATMRERAQVARHVSALSAEGRLSAYVLIALPIAVAVFMFVSRGEYLRPLYTQFLGLCLLGTAAALMAIGAFWLSRLIKVKV
jgi:tight adherence protein B